MNTSQRILLKEKKGKKKNIRRGILKHDLIVLINGTVFTLEINVHEYADTHPQTYIACMYILN